MKLNLKSTIAAPADHKSGQKALNGIIGNTRRGIVVDKTLDPDSNNPVANKAVSTALAALAGKIDAAAGGSVSPTLNLIDFENGEIRTTITEEEKTNIEKGLYNSVLYIDFSLEETGFYSIYFPENAVYAEDNFIFSIYRLSYDETSQSFSIISIRVYGVTIGEKNSDGTYPIEIQRSLEAPFSGSEGGGIPVVEGTKAELSIEEQAAGYDSKYTIPAAQTSSFILHSNDAGYILVDIFAKPSVAYGGVTSINRNNWSLISGSDTTVYISTYHPSSFYSTDFFGYFPNDETTSVDITFPWADRLSSPACAVSDADGFKFFVRNDGSVWGSFQTSIVYCNDGKYRCWYIEAKTGDTTHKLATIKCKIINIDGSIPDNVVLYGDLTPVA